MEGVGYRQSRDGDDMLSLAEIVRKLNRMYDGISVRPNFFGVRPDDVVVSAVALERFLIPHLITKPCVPSPYWAIAYTAFLDGAEPRFADDDWETFQRHWEDFQKWRAPQVRDVEKFFDGY